MRQLAPQQPAVYFALELVNPKLVLVLAVLVAGLPLSYWVGWKTGRSTFPLLLGITFVMFFFVNFSIPACIALKACVSGGDGDLSYVFGPLLATPAYWTTVSIAASRQSK